MEIFGLTFTGYHQYFRESMKDDYREPLKLPSLKEIVEERLRRDTSKSFNEIYNKFDPIIGTGDGFSYGSYKRLFLQRKKGLVKPVGPKEMYRVPITRAQEIGFWINISRDIDWIKSSKNYNRQYSDMSKYYFQLKIKNLILLIIVLMIILVGFTFCMKLYKIPKYIWGIYFNSTLFCRTFDKMKQIDPLAVI